MSHKYVYLFTEGTGKMRELLGGKGANLAGYATDLLVNVVVVALVVMIILVVLSVVILARIVLLLGGCRLFFPRFRFRFCRKNSMSLTVY